MTIQEINKAYAQIIDSLNKKELKNAFVFLHGLIASIHELSFLERLNELQDTYINMLSYRSKGIKDPMQESIYHTLLTSTYELTDKVKHKALSVISPLIYYSKKRSLQASTIPSFQDLHKQLEELNNQTDQEYEKIQLLLFQKIWLSDFLTVEDIAILKKTVTDTSFPYATGCQIVSALYLGLIENFDKGKIELLFDAAKSDQNEIRVRALISLILILYTFRERIQLYPQIKNRLEAIAEEIHHFNSILRIITLRFILTRETEKITRKLQEEILPEMMKLRSKMGKKINPKDITIDISEEGMNPEWEKVFNNTKIEKMMMEFSDLQQEGVDVMHSTFIHLKNYPFFREINNWFLPFTPSVSTLSPFGENPKKEKALLETLSNASFLCNSDKYSLYFSMMQLSEEHRKMMFHQFDSQTSEMIQQDKEELITKHGEVELIAGQYIQDLYRFYKLYPARKDFDDIFTWKLDFHNLPLLQSYFSEEESLPAIAEYYLRKNYVEDAYTIYQRLVKNKPEDATIFQKIGYCKQMMGDLEGALQSYLHADLLNSESKWVTKKIASCYRNLKQPEKALTYYQRYESLYPDDLSVQMSIGHCYMEMRKYDEALKYYFKIDYLDSKGHKIWRPIAWCSFLIGRYDQARNYYKKIIDTSPTMQDYLNAGHTEWALQNIETTLLYYKKAVETESGNFHKFREQFDQDIPDLIIAGIEEEEIPLILDQLRYLLG